MLRARACGAFTLSGTAAGGRARRVAELLQREVAQALPGLKDPRIRGLLTISAVELSRDMSVARLYYAVLGAPDDAELSAALADAARRLRRELGRTLHMKRTPELRFVPTPAGRVLPEADDPAPLQDDDA